MPNKYPRVVKDELDLHQYIRREAKDAVLSFLNISQERGYDLVRIITGKGLHSEEGPVLRDYVLDLLDKNGYEHSFAKIREGGEGAIDVKL